MKRGICKKQTPSSRLQGTCKEVGDNLSSRTELSHTFLLFLFLAAVPCPVFVLPSPCRVLEDIKYIDHLIDQYFIVNCLPFS